MLANATILAADHHLTDESIIDRVLGGHTEEYEILVRRYNQMLYKSAKGILDDEQDIEDAMQEAYIRGYEKLHQFRKEARFSTWLTRILINCALRKVNELRSTGKISMSLVDVEHLPGIQEMPESDQPMEIGENLRKAIEGAISHLPPKYRVVFILREVEQTSVADTASILGITEENVKIRLHRARLMLREILKSEVNSLELFEFHASRCALIAASVMEAIEATKKLSAVGY